MSLCFRDSTLTNFFCSKILLIISYDIKLFIFKILAIYTVLLWCSKVYERRTRIAELRGLPSNFMKWGSRRAACNITMQQPPAPDATGALRAPAVASGARGRCTVVTSYDTDPQTLATYPMPSWGLGIFCSVTVYVLEDMLGWTIFQLTTASKVYIYSLWRCRFAASSSPCHHDSGVDIVVESLFPPVCSGVRLLPSIGEQYRAPNQRVPFDKDFSS